MKATNILNESVVNFLSRQVSSFKIFVDEGTALFASCNYKTVLNNSSVSLPSEEDMERTKKENNQALLCR